ncbi:EAL domain-containing protein [Colwellia sp. 4_MG-2023]|uniref:sensor domain-containing phosphodiesterase n=1 Tax=unclassified Colwellia TaxID=196834 RepID=UPI0020901829|nr:MULTISPECIES: EAL domain-containing protein [unclassified Colwellia]MDO6508500.1 EAL domain-containing protein [Colwellia sp. 5_MG-2023]MDO6557115.1 EAL domain-containing protein [Colwellia sp. 4_MG-2023]MDO6652325.1 EAL domain-containing protein [Colwellia sp. 3_MG-2023]MDO6666915.1 EAL domain-containing protein [Colwellia sp. 2_MG-2023]MDO6691320.1 EAL domain-containing protein [Colwellia sp. 1_MG-2023]
MSNGSLKNNMDTAKLKKEETAEQALLTLQSEHQDLQLRYNALFNLNKLSQECEDLNHFYPKVHKTIASLMTAENFYVVTYDQTFNTLEFVYHVDEKDERPEGVIDYDALAGSFTHLVIESSQPLLVNPSLEKQLYENGKITQHGSTGTDWVGVPLLHNDLVIGVMVVQSYNEKVRYTEQDLNMLTFTGQHVVSAMIRLQDKERLTSAVNARTQELMAQIREREKSELLQESLYRISELANDASFDIDAFYSKVHNIVGQLINATNFFIAKYDEESDTIEYVYVVDEESNHDRNYFKKRKLSDHYSELVIRQQKTVLLTKQDMQELFESGQTRKPTSDEQSWLGVPLLYVGKLLGVMVIQSYSPRTIYSEQDAELLNFVSNHVSSAIKRREMSEIERQNHELLEEQVKLRTLALEEEILQRKQAEKKLKHTASHDSLTGLPNRAVFLDLLNHAIACNKRKPELSFAVLFLDLDRFKVVNDSLGHQAGDTLLKLIAYELSSILRGKDTVARLGGDEFVILIEDLESDQKAFDIAQRITDFLTEPFVINNQLVFTGTSIGILFSDKRYNDADTMLRDADTAMYHAKGNGKGRYEVFDASMHQRVQNALSLEADIREAIEWEEFIPYYQPIIQLNNEEIKGFEALARWPSHKRGFVYPDEFIPLAEETNLVQAIDFQILKKSCQQLKLWQDTLLRHDLYVSCNLFCNQFFSATLPDDIERILIETGLKPENLRVELTERALLENTEIVLSNMKALKRLGVKILLDDFGTGYSSLSYLHQFPIDVLKIDRSFINNFHEQNNSRAIIKTIIDLATSLGMATIGEGIESLENAQLLQKMDCLYGQGFYYAKPMPADEMEQYILSH